MPLTTEEQYLFDERAAIMEFDGGLDRGEAERKAMEYVLSLRKGETLVFIDDPRWLQERVKI
jgi:hypothetical protein